MTGGISPATIGRLVGGVLSAVSLRHRPLAPPDRHRRKSDTPGLTALAWLGATAVDRGQAPTVAIPLPALTPVSEASGLFVRP